MKLTSLRAKQTKTTPRDLPPYERGLYYENVVCRWLKKQGYHILDRNYRARKKSELDIVAKDKDTLVFIEVKARRKMSLYTPLRSIDERKRAALSLACEAYLRDLQATGVDTEELSVRYDVVALAFDDDGEPVSIDHYISYVVMNREDL